MRKTKEMKIKEAQGRKSRRIASENLTRVFLTIAQEPSSFSELLKKIKLSSPILMKHLKTLRSKDAIYRDIIKPTETANPKEIGKIVYKIKEDEMESFLMQAIHMNFTIADLVDDEELEEKLRGYAKEILYAIMEYVNKLRAKREQRLKKELERIQKPKREKPKEFTRFGKPKKE